MVVLEEALHAGKANPYPESVFIPEEQNTALSTMEVVQYNQHPTTMQADPRGMITSYLGHLTLHTTFL